MIDPEIWDVAGKTDDYIVTFHNNFWSCSCPHFKFYCRSRGEKCKHIEKIILEISKKKETKTVKRYVDIVFDEMNQFLVKNGFLLMEPPCHSNEFLFGKRVDKDGVRLSIRVWTSIDKKSKTSRASGQDAIRVEFFYMHKINADHFKPKRIGCLVNYRTKNWRDNVKDSIDYWESYKPIFCSVKNCNGLLVPRKGARGEFLGCSCFPDCKNTANL